MDVLVVDADAGMRYTTKVQFCQNLVGVDSVLVIFSYWLIQNCATVLLSNRSNVV